VIDVGEAESVIAVVEVDEALTVTDTELDVLVAYVEDPP